MTPEQKFMEWWNDQDFSGCSSEEEVPFKAWLEATRQAYEDSARIAESVWDEGKQGAHGGEQANRTAEAIRQRLKEYDNGN